MPSEEAPSTVEEIRAAVNWLATLLNTTTMPPGYTVGIFHEGPSPIEHFTATTLGLDSGEAERMMAAVQFTVLYHQIAHFAADATDEEWEAAMTRIAEHGDIGDNLTAAAMKEGRKRIKDPANSLSALLAASLSDNDRNVLRSLLGNTIEVPAGTSPEELLTILRGQEDPEFEAAVTDGSARGEAITYL